MKKRLPIIFLVIIFILFCGGFFSLGKYISDKEKDSILEGLVLNDLGNTLLGLRSFDTNQSNEAKRLLQAQTNGQLSWLIELEKTSANKQFSQQRCKVFNTLKQYREKHALFKTADWNDLLRDPEMKEEEEKRVKYLNNLSCGKDVFFKMP